MYWIIGFVWTVFAFFVWRKENSDINLIMILGLVVNFIFWPVCLFYHIFLKGKGEREEF